MSQYLVTCFTGGSKARSSSIGDLAGRVAIDDGPGSGNCEPGGGRCDDEELTDAKE